MDEKVKTALRLYEAAQEIDGGTITDADTILADIIAESAEDPTEFTEIGENVLKNYLKCKDKTMYKALFYDLTGVEFENFVSEVIERTTRG